MTSDRARSHFLIYLLIGGAVLLAGVLLWIRLQGSGPTRATGSATVPSAADLRVPEIAERATPSGARSVVLVGLDGADWRYLDELIAAGRMPHLARMRETSVWGVLLSEEPMLSPLLWTSMMTGTSPLEHRILDFVRTNPESGTLEPIPSSERMRPAIWNMASMAGRSVGVFGLWGTWPAEPLRGVLVSDRLASFFDPHFDAESVELAYPEKQGRLAETVMRDVEREVDLASVRRYLPRLSRERYEQALAVADAYSDPVAALRRILVQTEIYGRLSLTALEESAPDLTLVYFEGTDAVGHVFAPYIEPPMPGIDEEESRRFADVPATYYEYVDEWIGRIAQWAEEHGATVMLVSDHGFRWHERPDAATSFEHSTAALWHRAEGVYLLHSPGIRPRRLTEVAGGVRQVCATLLALLGLPAGVDIAGPPLPGVKPSPSGEVDYLAHFRKPQEPATESAADRQLAKLRALGYLGSDEDSSPALASSGTLTPGALNNMATLLRDDGRPEEALAVYRRALKTVDGGREPYLRSNYAHLLQEMGRVDDARKTFTQAARDAAAELENEPGNSRLRVLMADALRQAGRYGAAARTYRSLVEMQPESERFRQQEAAALEAAGEYGEARNRLEQGVRRLPKSGDLAHALAHLLATAPDRAVRDPNRALELAGAVFRASPTIEHGETLVLAFSAAGQTGHAETLIDKLIEDARAMGRTDAIAGLEQLRRATLSQAP